MMLYNQRDPKWANMIIGNSPLLVGKQGCAGTALTMLSTCIGKTFNPLFLFSDPTCFNDAGLILWNVAAKKLGLTFVFRDLNYNEKLARAYVADPNKFCLLQVQCPPYGQHWVVAVSYSVLFGWRIADPLTGTYRWIKDTKYTAPTGAAYFSK